MNLYMPHSPSRWLPVTLAILLAACSHKVEVTVTEARVRTLVAQVTESGTIQPAVEVPIAPDISGEVTAIHVREGDYVKRGQLLFEIRPDNYQAALEQSNASVNSARAEVSNTEAGILSARNQLVQDSIQHQRQLLLFKEKVVSEQEYQQAQLRWQLSQASYQAALQSRQAAFYRSQSAAASMRQSLDQLNRTRVYASMEGTVTFLKLELGQRVVGTGMMAGTEVIKIADLSEMDVQVLVNENDIVRLHMGDSAQVEVDAYRSRRFRGKVVEIAYSAEKQELGTSDQITNYAVKVRMLRESYAQDSTLMRQLKAHESPFRPGMSAVVHIYTERAENVVSVPIQAVTVSRNPAADKSKDDAPTVVFLYDKATQTVKSQPVKTGTSDDTYIQVTTGLKAGDTVVSGPFSVIEKVLQDGMEVSILPEGNLPAQQAKSPAP
ncbi:MAG: efflux RND transporter periplasmic adaptor subunit [Bacteroidetes bacterium]|nr:efflux RND transporter periplasmic adaptor subunit [Bacteroidota bacterium]